MISPLNITSPSPLSLCLQLVEHLQNFLDRDDCLQDDECFQNPHSSPMKRLFPSSFKLVVIDAADLA